MILSFAKVVITIYLVDLFDTMGSLVGIATKAGMVDENSKFPCNTVYYKL